MISFLAATVGWQNIFDGKVNKKGKMLRGSVKN